MTVRSGGTGWTGLLLGGLLVLAAGVAWLVWTRQVVTPPPLAMDVRLPAARGPASADADAQSTAAARADARTALS